MRNQSSRRGKDHLDFDKFSAAYDVQSFTYALMAEGKFPKPVVIGPKSVAWLDAKFAERSPEGV